MIKVLEKNIADKIAAGEVIDRPVSIVKELLENSLDAGSDSITLQIQNGGKSYIRVSDNGCGIAHEEAETAFMRHATSKISAAKDLNAIETLGFRGEALASICAVSRVELITKTKESKTGCKLVVEGSQVLENTVTGCPEGTTVTVRDLFYNVPARRKFLSTDNGETRRIVDMVSRIALSYSDVRISLINGNTTLFTTQGKGNILNNILTIYGKDLGDDLLPVDYRVNNCVIKGYVSSPGKSLASRSRQIFCVNGRVVTSKLLEKSIDDAYKEKLFAGRFPVAFLFVAIPAIKLDVNIHPTKKEIRFDDNSEIEDFVKEGIKRALTVKESIPQIKNDLKGKKSQDRKQVDINSLLSTLREEITDRVVLEVHEEKEVYNEPKGIYPKKPAYRPFDIDSVKIIGTLFNTYILGNDDDNFYLIDQHAAHERIFYERLLSQYNAEEKTQQRLLVPLNFNVDAQVYATEDMWIDKVRDLGYDIENFGSKTYIVREVPAFIDIIDAEAFIREIFIEFEGKQNLSNKGVLEKIIMRSCKSAIKGGDHLESEEIDGLLKDLKACVNPFSCPHGRPTFVRMSKYEIEKMFKRV
ncbi:MAG: DNA mismatch repair endonuclease MutL [Clostridiales bacterium]|nr:DNA mismatch repair endonuclease MutL [Clostridiales bacterium]